MKLPICVWLVTLASCLPNCYGLGTPTWGGCARDSAYVVCWKLQRPVGWDEVTRVLGKSETASFCNLRTYFESVGFEVECLWVEQHELVHVILERSDKAYVLALPSEVGDSGVYHFVAVIECFQD